MRCLHPDVAALYYNIGFGEFSVEEDLRFEQHIVHLHEKHVLMTRDVEPLWFPLGTSVKIKHDNFIHNMVSIGGRD